MSKYIDADLYVEMQIYDDEHEAWKWWKGTIEDLLDEWTEEGCPPTIEVSKEDELKFYYVDSIDDYWIGQRLDNLYYAKWNGRLGFVWSASRYLPWGEHIVDENTLWKEHTYPSEPREIPFTEWIVGFMKKHTSEDAISRANAIKAVKNVNENYTKEGDREWHPHIDFIVDALEQVAPSVIPTNENEIKLCRNCDNAYLYQDCLYCDEIEEETEIEADDACSLWKLRESSVKPKEGEWIEDEYGIPRCSECNCINNTVYRYFCGNCGAKMKGAE